MEKCVNHPEREALSFCHNCGKHYCRECLFEGKEYYYCKEPACREALLKESGVSEMPLIISCPNCQSEIELSESEKASGKLHCPECEEVIDVSVNPPIVLNKENYVALVSTLNQVDIALVKTILDDAKIDYYIFFENFLAIRPLLEPVRFFVNQEQAEEACTLLSSYEFKIFGLSKNDY
jgi:uncharacterized protein YbaR (Trm112 family)